MAILINFFDNVILQAISEEIVPKVSFFKDRYFPTGAGDIFKANEVLTEYRSGDRKLAAFVDQKAGDIPIGRRSYEISCSMRSCARSLNERGRALCIFRPPRGRAGKFLSKRGKSYGSEHSCSGCRTEA